MATTLTNIQADAQHYANDSQLNILTGQGQRVANQLYIGMCTPGYRHGFASIGMAHLGRRWRELLKADTSITTTSGTSKYTWPATPIFFEGEYKVLYIDVSASSDETPIDPVTDIDEWAENFSTSTGSPSVYMLYHDGTNNMIEFRPTPNTTGDTIKIWGHTQPTSLTASASTVFIQQNADKALSMLIAADYLAKRGKTQRAAELLDEAKGILPIGDRGVMMHRSRLRKTTF